MFADTSIILHKRCSFNCFSDCIIRKIENGASLDTENVVGKVIDKFLGYLNMDSSCPDGQPTHDASGQKTQGGTIGSDSPMSVVNHALGDARQFGVEGSIFGQNGKGGLTDGNGHKGNGSNYVAGSGQNMDSGVGQFESGHGNANGKASSYIPKPHDANARALSSLKLLVMFLVLSLMENRVSLVY